ncbi:hypothetical protein [uncultured Jannaschia sp.]|uniref:hypothetical protein n=1 Tax=uncultured Jannaschia sp. TaxID=293347 RepID=UPI002616B833|nr:hypothetical protein [uncultured Jannaschia sp.]
MPPLLAIFAWPVIGAVLFQKLRLPLAILVTLIGGFLLLPERGGIDFPVLPPLNKSTVPALTALLMAILLVSPRSPEVGLAGAWSRLTLARFLLLGLIASAFLSVATNSDTLVYGGRVLAGLSLYDGFSIVLNTLMMVLPMFLARKYLATPEAHRMVLLTLCLAGLAYSFLALVEIRLSPQLNRWIYGFFPHSFAQHVRGGGYRPLVFLSHGLVLAIFFSGTIFAAIGLARLDARRRTQFLLAAFWLLAVLTLSRSLGALVITLALLPVALFLTIRMQMIFAVIVASIFLTYPVLRGSGFVPLDRITSAAASIDAGRASSLQTRFDNEEMILGKAEQRPIFGWGSWGRWRVYDSETGADITISDGHWVIVIGAGGWTRYLFEFGLLTMPIFLLFLRSGQLRVGRETSTLALILAANLIDLIPNASVTPITWILAGALWGRLEVKAPEHAAETSASVVVDEPIRAYVRSAMPETMSRPTAMHTRKATQTQARDEKEAHAAPTSLYTRQTTRITRTPAGRSSRRKPT